MRRETISGELSDSNLQMPRALSLDPSRLPEGTVATDGE